MIKIPSGAFICSFFLPKLALYEMPCVTELPMRDVHAVFVLREDNPATKKVIIKGGVGYLTESTSCYVGG